MSLAEFLGTLGINWSKGEAPRTDRFIKLLDDTREGPHAEIVNEVVLRTQMQAIYSSENIGHFGLNLARYAHFTSPIRRYADLLVHRALIRGLRLGPDGLTEAESAGFEDTAVHITATERRAQLAERDAVDRYLAAYMVEKVGNIFDARISGVTRFGLFVTITDSGASGIVPTSSLPDDFWMHDERTQSLTGRRSGISFRLAQPVDVRLSEASPVTGGLVFHILQGAEDNGRPAKGGFRGRPAGGRPRRR